MSELICDVCQLPIPPESRANKIEAGAVEGDACDACYAWLLAPEEAPPSSMSVVDEDRLTRRNADHLDDWRFR